MYNKKSRMENLVNKTVRELFIGPKEEDLIFKCDDIILSYSVDGDCCSESWFADITGLDALFGHKITKIEEVKMPEAIPDGRTRQEYDALYCIKISTDGGMVDIIFRNSSNG